VAGPSTAIASFAVGGSRVATTFSGVWDEWRASVTVPTVGSPDCGGPHLEWDLPRNERDFSLKVGTPIDCMIGDNQTSRTEGMVVARQTYEGYADLESFGPSLQFEQK
jgi:hypothetical protein